MAIKPVVFLPQWRKARLSVTPAVVADATPTDETEVVETGVDEGVGIADEEVPATEMKEGVLVASESLVTNVTQKLTIDGRVFGDRAVRRRDLATGEAGAITQRTGNAVRVLRDDPLTGIIGDGPPRDFVHGRTFYRFPLRLGRVSLAERRRR